jgi:glutathione S-transferase
MSLKLIYMAQTRATRPRWVLEELGVPYELVSLGRSDLKSEANSHPLKQVPALVDGDQTIIESAAIALYLADKFADKGLAPALDSPARGDYYQWTFYAMTMIETKLVDIFLNTVADFVPADQKKPEVAEAAKAALPALWQPLAAHLAKQDYVAGAFSAADCVVSLIVGWGFKMRVCADPVLSAYLKRCTSRPAFAKANA